jgi:hypothetical protein
MSQLRIEASTSKLISDALPFGFGNDHALLSARASLINSALLVKGGHRYCWPFMAGHFVCQYLELDLQQEISY